MRSEGDMKTATTEKIYTKDPLAGQATRMSDISQFCTGGFELERESERERERVREREQAHSF